MDHFQFSESALPIREDIQASFRNVWKNLASPGNWFTGEERVAIAAASRSALSCKLCAQRKDSLSPASVSGTHDSDGSLPEAVVDVVHKCITDQTRISQRWVDGVLEGKLNGRDAEGEYVEIIGIVVNVFSIDEFLRAAGLPIEPLPKPVPGDPSLYRPPLLETDTGFVPMIPADGLSDADSDLWGEMTANVLRALSLVPDCVRTWLSLSDAMYVPLHFMGQPGLETGRPIDRMQTELVAGRVSSHNECFY